MKNLFSQMVIKVNKNIYLKDPDSSEIGRKIISNSISLIDEIGFDAFTFKKLGDKIGSPESTIYRYFENKYLVLHYLISWYWSWIEYRLAFATANISSPEQKLTVALNILTENIEEDTAFSYIEEPSLYRVVVAESTKSYFKKNVENENKKGLFSVYKRVVQRVAELVLLINPVFKYPHMLISTVIEGSHQQKHFAKHLPALTDTSKNSNNISEFYFLMVFNTIA